VLFAVTPRIATLTVRGAHSKRAQAPIHAIPRGDTMKQQETRGKVKKLKGRVEQATGIVTGNESLERKGAR